MRFNITSSQVQRELGLDYAFANTLDVDETTGEDDWGVFCWTMESDTVW